MPSALRNPKRPDALELFTDRVGEQKTLRHLLQPPPGDALGRRYLLSVFYGVGGVGKTSLCQLGQKIAQEEFSGQVTCAGTSFDDARWKPDTQFTEVAAEICRCFAHAGISLPMTLALLALYAQQTGDTSGGGLESNWALALEAFDKGIELTGVPGLALLIKGAHWMRERSQRHVLRQRLNDLGLWPEEQHGRVNVSDLEGKLATSLFHDTVGWLKDHPDKHLRLMLDGFERLQGHERRENSQKHIQEFIGYFAGSHEPNACGHFRVLLFGRERLRWDELYQDPGWNEFWNQHLLGGLAEDDAKDLIGKTRIWLRGHGQGALADALVRNEKKILDASDENVHGQRAFHPYYLNLAVELVERARQQGTEPDLGRAPAELQDRFFRYLDKKELRALKILALSEIFDEALFDWLARERLIDFPVHSFHTELRQEHSYIQPVEGHAGDWKFHRLFEDALHARWQNTEEERTEGGQVVRRLLDYYGNALKQKLERDWTEVDVEQWRRGMEILVTQGPELGLLCDEEWRKQVAQEPWSTEYFCGSNHRLDFTRRILVVLEEILGPEHPDALKTVVQVGNLLRNKCDYDGAEALYRRALEGREKALGPEHPKTLTVVNNLGVLLNDKGDSENAELLSRRAAKGREKALGIEHLDTLMSINNLAVMLHTKGDYDEAEALYRLALQGREKALGPEHPKTLMVVNNLGVLLKDKGDYDRAESLLRRALEGKERALGLEHPSTLETVSNLGVLFKKRGDFAGSLQYLRRAFKGRVEKLGEAHSGTLETCRELVAIHRIQGDLSNATSLLRNIVSASPSGLKMLRQDLACCECLSGNLEAAKRLIAEEIAAKPAAREQALQENDLKPIHDFIRSLPGSPNGRGRNPT